MLNKLKYNLMVKSMYFFSRGYRFKTRGVEYVCFHRLSCQMAARKWVPPCHAPTPAVILQPLVVRCGTTERFLFNNTNVYGLRLIQYKHA